MKTWISFFLVVLCFSLAGWIFWSEGWENGYIQGQKVAHAYYLATNSTPDKEWAYDRDNFHNDTVYKVLETFQPKTEW